MEPKVGDIWLDDNGDHNLILEISHSKDACGPVVHILTLDTSQYWDNNPLEDFGTDKYFHTRVA
jgi:hypothetical protein